MDLDLNCDLGEGCAFDADLIPLVTSVNIACGFHAGDPATAYAAFAAASARRSGRRPSELPGPGAFRSRRTVAYGQEIFEDCVYQVGRWRAWQAAGCGLTHLKPHGAALLMACRRTPTPAGPCRMPLWLTLFGLLPRLQSLSSRPVPMSLLRVSQMRYLPDGSLVPRSRADAFVTDSAEAAKPTGWPANARVPLSSACTAIIPRRVCEGAAKYACGARASRCSVREMISFHVTPRHRSRTPDSGS